MDPASNEVGLLLFAAITLGTLFTRTYLSLLEVYGEQRLMRQQPDRFPIRSLRQR